MAWEQQGHPWSEAITVAGNCGDIPAKGHSHSLGTLGHQVWAGTAGRPLRRSADAGSQGIAELSPGQISGLYPEPGLSRAPCPRPCPTWVAAAAAVGRWASAGGGGGLAHAARPGADLHREGESAGGRGEDGRRGQR